MSIASTTIQALMSLFPGFSGEFPEQLKIGADNLLLQSRYSLPLLRPDEEAARALICALLAFEKAEGMVQDSMLGQIPNTHKVPLNPTQFRNLVLVFRNSLFPYDSKDDPLISTSRSPKKSSKIGISPKKNISNENVLVVSPSKTISENLLASKTPLLCDTSQINIVGGADLKEKKGKKGTKASGSRTNLKLGDPKKDQIIQLCSSLNIENPVIFAILKSYRIYNNLVKDRWGLLCGIIVVITSKARPKLINRNKQAFYNKLKHLTSMSDERLDEWVGWAARIINDQSWVKKVTDSSSNYTDIKKVSKKYSSGIGNMV